MRTARLTLIVASLVAGAYALSAFTPVWSHSNTVACGDKKKQDDKKKDDKKS
jgi:hypothetical protein